MCDFWYSETPVPLAKQEDSFAFFSTGSSLWVSKPFVSWNILCENLAAEGLSSREPRSPVYRLPKIETQRERGLLGLLAFKATKVGLWSA